MVGYCDTVLALALVTVSTVPLLQALGRRLLSMASGPRDPGDPGDPDVPYVPGSLSAAFVTCPNETVAKELGSYTWKGKVEEDSEVLMMIKTRSSKIPALAEFVRSAHPYEVPELVALPVAQGNPPYLRWVGDSVPP
ncbi:protein CutA isoform X3 [Grus americana]|uniref:protein CutA isoform X3 n=1 Tax=Grus americana TaxID=9117 RepID=UPI00240888E6|nr:protein CutA isoform X3 [Grus americana]